MKSAHVPRFALSAVTLALLAACGSGGGDEEPARVAITGVVADGPLAGATVCYDLNDNEACDTDEPTSALTTADGAYSLDVDEASAGKHAVLALVPATAVDKDTGAAVGVALKFKSPATGSSSTQAVFVSPLTTAVADVAKETGKSTADATQQVKDALGLGTSPLANFVGSTSSADVQAATAARALTSLQVDAIQLSTAAGVSAADANRFARSLVTGNLATVATALAEAPTGTVAERAAQAVAAVKSETNLSAATAKAVAEATNQPSSLSVAPGPFVSLRRFAYTDANNYSYALFTGDSSKTNSAGEFVASEVRKTQSSGAEVPFNRNQMYWTGSTWTVCPLQWEVSVNKLSASTNSQTGVYCGASRSQTQFGNEDISGKTLREVVTSIRAYPLADTVSASTNADGLPVNWGPDPALLPADAKFPAGSVLNRRRQQADIGGTDRIELTTKSSVLWPDGRFRQATTLEQMGSMSGDLVTAGTAVTGNNTVFVNDLPLASQSDPTLEAFKRWRAGLDISSLKARFYQCNVRKSDGASLNCVAAGVPDATLAISTQGGARLLRFASAYPAALSSQLKSQRFWAEHSGTVFRANRDLPYTRSDQRLNAVAWDALRAALGIPAHTAAVAPVQAGPFETLRSFTFTDLANYTWRILKGDSSVVDSTGHYLVSEERGNISGGVSTPFARGQLMWTGSEWYDCPSSGTNIASVGTIAPFDSLYCKSYLEERQSLVTLTLDGRRISDVVNDIRAYGSKDGSFDYGGWGPSPSAHPTLASSFFPAGSTMEYRGLLRKASPITLGTAIDNKVRVAPAANTTAAFDTWPYATSLEEFIAKYPGDFQGGSLNGNVAFWVHGITLAAAPSALYNRSFEWRVAFDANGQKARFYNNNRAASTGFTTNYVKLLDTTYTIETVGGYRVLKFAAMPAGFENDYLFQRMFGERDGAVWYAWKDAVPSTPMYSIRLNRPAIVGLENALGIVE